MTDEELTMLRDAIRGLAVAGLEVTVENAVAVAARAIARLRAERDRIEARVVGALGAQEAGALLQGVAAEVAQADALEEAARAAYGGGSAPSAPVSPAIDLAARTAYGGR